MTKSRFTKLIFGLFLFLFPLAAWSTTDADLFNQFASGITATCTSDSSGNVTITGSGFPPRNSYRVSLTTGREAGQDDYVTPIGNIQVDGFGNNDPSFTLSANQLHVGQTYSVYAVVGDMYGLSTYNARVLITQFTVPMVGVTGDISTHDTGSGGTGDTGGTGGTGDGGTGSGGTGGDTGGTGGTGTGGTGTGGTGTGGTGTGGTGTGGTGGTTTTTLPTTAPATTTTTTTRTDTSGNVTGTSTSTGTTTIDFSPVTARLDSINSKLTGLDATYDAPSFGPNTLLGDKDKVASMAFDPAKSIRDTRTNIINSVTDLRTPVNLSIPSTVDYTYSIPFPMLNKMVVIDLSNWSDTILSFRAFEKFILSLGFIVLMTRTVKSWFAEGT